MHSINYILIGTITDLSISIIKYLNLITLILTITVFKHTLVIVRYAYIRHIHPLERDNLIIQPRAILLKKRGYPVEYLNLQYTAANWIKWPFHLRIFHFLRVKF